MEDLTRGGVPSLAENLKGRTVPYNSLALTWPWI